MTLKYTANMSCSASCGRLTSHPRYPFCKACWALYGKLSPRPEWVSMLIQEHRRERYAIERDRKRTMSLDTILDRQDGEEWLQEQMENYAGQWGSKFIKIEELVGDPDDI